MTEPPNKRDLELSAHFLTNESIQLREEGHNADADSLSRVAELCQQLVPALEQFGPMMEAFVRSQG